MVFSHLKKIEFSKLFGSADCVSKISKYNHDNEDDENHIFFSFTYTILRVIENFKIILMLTMCSSTLQNDEKNIVLISVFPQQVYPYLCLTMEVPQFDHALIMLSFGSCDQIETD